MGTLDKRRLAVYVLLALIGCTLVGLWHFQYSSPTFDRLLAPFSQAVRTPEPITYIPYTFGWAMLLQTLRGYRNAGWKNIVVLDNSWDRKASVHCDLLTDELGVLDVLETPVRLRFAQLQAYMDWLARDAEAGYYFWSHTDVLLVPQPGESAYETAMASVQHSMAEGNLGVLFFMYDIISAVTTTAGQLAPWDPSMPQYGADCDRYRRLRLAGLEATDSILHIGEIIHIHGVLHEEEMVALYDETAGSTEERAAVVREISNAENQYAWRFSGNGGDEMEERDMVAAEAEALGGRLYHFAKWGDNPACELLDRTPAFDVPLV